MLDRRSFGDSDQESFAALSGDWNPMHVDPVVARRELFGERVVHGLHGVLRALDAYLGARGDRAALRRLRARFKGPLFLGQPVETRIVEDARERARLQAACGERVALDLELAFDAAGGAARAGAAPPSAPPGAAPRTPERPTLASLEGRRGALPLYLDRAAAARSFPSLAAALPAATLAELLAVTRLVGMVCPGLRSILSSVDVEIAGEPRNSAALEYSVARVDPRFSAIRLAVSGPTLSGVVEAFHRPEPQPQPGMDEVAKAIEPGAHRGTALVVGGSRGLGEVTAKLVAAGGGHPIVTFREGRADAERVAEEIRASGRPCTVLALDVAAPRDGLAPLATSGIRPDALYYFASPKIFVTRSVAFDPRLFDSFARCYVTDFSATVAACRELQRDALAVFYPSSVAIDERVKALVEYAAAKAAGETLAEHLARFDPGLRLLVRRLPRIATDQTLTIAPQPAASALDVMLPIVREMGAARR